MDVRAFLLLFILHLAQSAVVDLSCDQIHKFVDGHNLRRHQLAQGQVEGQPGAAEMKFMIWDEELAAKASRWAANHKFSHNPDKTIPSGRFSTGENIYMSSSFNPNDELDVDNALSAWFNEHNDYTYGPLPTVGWQKIGHYTQMVWSDSIYVGCAVSEKIQNGKESIVVCNYGPAGNVLGQPPYKANAQGTGQLVCYTEECKRPYGDKCQ